MPDYRPNPDDEKPFGWAQMPAKWARQYVAVLEFLGYLAVLGYIGHWLDVNRGWQPWGTFGGLMLGMVAGLYRMIREANRMDTPDRSARKPGEPPEKE